LYVALNIIALTAHRTFRVPTGLAFTIVATMGGFMGGVGALLETEAKVGLNRPVLVLQATLVGLIVGVASSFVVGYGVAWSVTRLGLPTIGELLNGKPHTDLPADQRKDRGTGSAAPSPPDQPVKPST